MRNVGETPGVGNLTYVSILLCVTQKIVLAAFKSLQDDQLIHRIRLGSEQPVQITFGNAMFRCYLSNA